MAEIDVYNAHRGRRHLRSGPAPASTPMSASDHALAEREAEHLAAATARFSQAAEIAEVRGRLARFGGRYTEAIEHDNRAAAHRAVVETRRGVAETRIGGIRVVADPSMPPGVARVLSAGGTVTITNIGPQ